MMMKQLFKTTWQKWFSLRLSQFKSPTRCQSLNVSFVGISLGGVTLLCVLSVMNGFQRRYQDNLREISSFHLRIKERQPDIHKPPNLPYNSQLYLLFPFTETPALVQSFWTTAMPCLVKGIELDIFEKDKSFHELLTLKEGTWQWKNGEVLIGDKLAYVLGVEIGETIELSTLRSSKTSFGSLNHTQAKVAGIWQSEYYPLSRYTIFMPLEETLEHLSAPNYLLWAVKFKNPYQINVQVLSQMLEGAKLSTWQEENKNFLEALTFEKNTMTLLLALIFLIVGLNTYYSLRETVLRHQEDIAVLKALGASPTDCNKIFLREGLNLGLWGSLSAISFGLMLCLSLNEILAFIQTVGNLLLSACSYILSCQDPYFSLALKAEGANSLPMKVYFKDVLLIYTVILVSNLSFSWFAIVKLTKQRPLHLFLYKE